MRRYRTHLIALVAPAAILASGPLAPARAQDNATLREDVAALTARVAELEAAERSPLSFGVGTNTTVEIYGYVKADFIADFDTDLGTTTFGLGSLVPGGFTGSDFQAHAFQSRLGIRTTTQTSLGELGTQIEGDFFGGGGGTFRLRHATATLGPWRIGQYWTNFMPLTAYPSTLDFQGPAGIPFARVAQVRYTHDFGNGLTGSVSLEDPVATSSQPVITGAIAYQGDGFFLRGAALFGSTDGPNQSVDAFGFTASGTVDLWEGGALAATYTTGEAISSYMVFGGSDFITAGAVDTAVESEGFTLGLTHQFNDKWAVGAAYGYRDDNIGAATDTRRLETLHVNLLYTPIENVSVGVEYFTGERTQFDGTTASADRVQASVQFSF